MCPSRRTSDCPRQLQPAWLDRPLRVLSDSRICAVNDPVTIVVPVYGALEETMRCLGAVKDTTRSAENLDVLVIDDASPSSGFFDRLRDAVEEFGYGLRRNERNLGFVGTCNRAIEEITTGHVLLLNSDTQPSGRWLERMVAALDDGVASVIPASNNATIYSVPYVGFDSLTHDLGVDQIADIVESLDRDPIDIPVPVGFCMLMSRSALDEVGGFDPVFGAGYGEEEDWALRATRNGFTHRLSPNAFVFHAGGVSMSAAGVLERGVMTHEANADILRRRYPEREGLVSEFLDQPAIHAFRNEVTADLIGFLRSKRRRIVHWLHADPFSPQAAGTERAVKTLVEGLEADFYQTIVFPDGSGCLSVVEAVNGMRTRSAFPIAVTADDDAVPAWRRIGQAILEAAGAEVLHFHHGYRSSGAVAALSAADLSIPLVVSLHDFSLICPRNHLLDRWGAFCGVPHLDLICDACVTTETISMSEWRKIAQSTLRRADAVVVASRDVLDLMGRAIELPDTAKIFYLPPPYGTESMGEAAVKKRERPATGHVLIAGRTEAYHKGNLIVQELVHRLVAHGIEVHSIGTAEHRSYPGFNVHGEYRQGELPGLLTEIDPDLAIIPSIVPETYSLLLSELWRANLPVLALDSGAIADRIRRTGGGFLVSSGTAGAFADRAIDLLADSEQLDSARDALRRQSKVLSASATTTVERYREIYESLLAGQAMPGGMAG